MLRFAVLTLFAVAGCAGEPIAPTQSLGEVRPVVAEDNLQGRWTVIAVNGRQVNGLWLELGGEGLGSVTKTANGIFVGTPQPRTEAFLGCNNWYPNGWMRNGDKLTFGMEMR